MYQKPYGKHKKNYIEIEDLGKMSGLNQIKETKKFNIYKKIIKLLIQLQHINIKKIKTLKKIFTKFLFTVKNW